MVPAPYASFGDHALEVLVLERVVFRANRQLFDAGIVGEAAGHGPGLEDAVHFETKIVVEPSRLVPVDDEDRSAGPKRGFPGRRLRSSAEVPLFSIGVDGLGLRL